MKTTLFILVLVLFSTFCIADNDWKNEATVYSGISFSNAETEQELCPFCALPITFTSRQSVSSSVLFGFKYGHYFTENIEVEGNFSIGPNREIEIENSFFCPPGEICPLEPQAPFTLLKQNAVTYYYDGNFVYNFPTSKVTPFFSAGLGGVSTDRDFFDTEHDLALTFGGGAKFRFENVGFRIEVVDRIIPDYFLTNDTENDLQVQYGVMFRF